MRMAMTLAVAGLLGAATAKADERPAGPPWTAMCQDFEKDQFYLTFFTPECQAEFQAYYDAHTPAETHAWMKGRRECFHEWAHFAWIVMAQHSAKMAELAWRQQIYVADQRLLGGTCDDHDCALAAVRGELERAEAVTAIGDETKARTTAFLDQVELSQKYEPQMTKAYASVNAICLFHLNVECIGALKQAFDWMYPRMYEAPLDPVEHYTFSMLPFYREVFADAKTQVYAARLAAKLMDVVGSGAAPARIEETLYEVGPAVFEGDLDRFWKFMIVYATRGAAWATAYQMVGEDNRPLFAAFMVVSAAMGVIDTHEIEEGRAFSYAPTDGMTCFEPKPYHFWMAGGFAYLLRQKGYSERTAELVARLTGALYEAASTTEGRTPDAVFFVPEFATIVNRERRELTHHFLGAQLGLHPAAPAPLAFDAKLGEFLAASSPLPAMSADEMAAKIQDSLTRWQYWTSLTGWYLRRN